MKVIDLNGCPIEITDLKEAIKIARRYKEYRHEEKIFSEFDKKAKCLLDGYVRETYSNQRAINNILKIYSDEH